MSPVRSASSALEWAAFEAASLLEAELCPLRQQVSGRQTLGAPPIAARVCMDIRRTQSGDLCCRTWCRSCLCGPSIAQPEGSRKRASPHSSEGSSFLLEHKPDRSCECIGDRLHRQRWSLRDNASPAPERAHLSLVGCPSRVAVCSRRPEKACGRSRPASQRKLVALWACICTKRPAH